MMLPELPDRGAAAGERRPDVERDVGVEQFVGGIGDVHARDLIACVVDQDVEPAEMRDGLRDEAIDDARLSDVAVQQYRLPAARHDVGGDGFRLGLAAAVVHGDAGAAPAESPRRRRADAPARAGDQADLSRDVEFAHDFLPCRNGSATS